MDDTVRPTIPVDDTSSPPAAISHQARISVAGEMVGLAVSIGAVYAAERLAPRQLNAFTERLARALGEHRGTGSEQQLATARKIADFSIMNIGGLMNVGTQFALHRHAQPRDERAPLASDFGRVLTGRAVGTGTAGLALLMAEKYLPGRMLGHQSRLGELAISSLIQSAGALPGNISAQLLYDQLLGTHKSRT